MRPFTFPVLVLLANLFSTPGVSQETGARKLVAETNHSTIEFSVPISEGLTRITGKFTQFSIDVDFIDNDLTKSRILVKIIASSINTGIPDRDADLKTSDFFDVEKFPDITFTTEKMETLGDGYVATGTMKIHGISKGMTIPFKLTGQKNENVIGFTSRFSIKRSDFGVGTTWKHTTDDHFIADEIAIEVDFWTKKPKATN